MTAAPSRPSPPAHVRARGLWNLLNLATPLGLVGAVVAGCALRPGPHGLIEAHGWTHRVPGGAAFSVGDVVFTRPGLGRLTVSSVGVQDIPVVQGVVLFAALVFVVVNLVLDLVYPLLDPRIATAVPA